MAIPSTSFTRWKHEAQSVGETGLKLWACCKTVPADAGILTLSFPLPSVSKAFDSLSQCFYLYYPLLPFHLAFTFLEQGGRQLSKACALFGKGYIANSQTWHLVRNFSWLHLPRMVLVKSGTGTGGCLWGSIVSLGNPDFSVLFLLSGEQKQTAPATTNTLFSAALVPGFCFGKATLFPNTWVSMARHPMLWEHLASLSLPLALGSKAVFAMRLP